MARPLNERSLSIQDLGFNPAITAPASAPAPYFEQSMPYVQPAPAPTYYPSTPAPVQNYDPSYAAGGNTANYGYGGGATSYGGQAPVPQPRPVISDSDWLAGDSTYQNQLGQLNSALSDFLARLNTQRTDFTTDYNTAMQGLQRNEDMGMQNLGEDFAARGMSNSGLFGQAQQQAKSNYQNQRNAAERGYTRGNSNFDIQESDKRTSTQQGLDNAKQQSLARLAAQQMF